MITASISTLWMFLWMVIIVLQYEHDEHDEPDIAYLLAWFITGWLPPLFYQLILFLEAVR